MNKLSDQIELLIAVEVATKGSGYYQKNNWNKWVSIADQYQDFVNLKFEVVARNKETGVIYIANPVKIKTENQDLDYYSSGSKFRETKITRYIPYTSLAEQNLNYLVGDLKLIANKLTSLFAQKPENTTVSLHKMFK